MVTSNTLLRLRGSRHKNQSRATRELKENQEYVPPSLQAVPTSYYGYYRTSYAVVYELGYFKTNTTFRSATILYSVANGDLACSGRSETLNPNLSPTSSTR
jgi:hypothetical protein